VRAAHDVEEAAVFKKVLIANRGEIAVRVLAACRQLGIDAVTVHSEADARAPHALEASESVLIGPAPVPQSYLNVDRILAVAAETGCDAVHPGYGLLSENPTFARRCAEAGLTFIGPSPDVIAAMGSKTQARETMAAHGLPVVPGSPGPARDLAHAEAIATELGYPVMLKAAAGGGGIGMQALHDPSELEKAWKMATARAKAYFGDDTMYVEKLIVEPRHIEVVGAALRVDEHRLGHLGCQSGFADSFRPEDRRLLRPRDFAPLDGEAASWICHVISFL
jgi:acetyl-CoA carboxylase biotin carboxylase subunit